MPEILPINGDLARDLAADLALCERASPHGYAWAVVVYESSAQAHLDAAAIAAVKEAWPSAIRRALSAEAERDQLREQIRILLEKPHA